jgi:fumarate reductase subunit C
MLRELSSVFIALFLLIYLYQIYQLTQGPKHTSPSLED